MKKLKIVVQMDPIELIDPMGDSTFAMMLEAQNRGHDLSYYTPDSLALDNGVLSANVAKVRVTDTTDDEYFELGEFSTTDLSQFDVLLLRQDPPFDMNYITITHMLETIHPKTLVVNAPAEVRNAPEKILVTEFPDLMPPTLITRDRGMIKAFREKHTDIIVKPLHGNGGAGVFFIKQDDQNLVSLLEMFEQD